MTIRHIIYYLNVVLHARIFNKNRIVCLYKLVFKGVCVEWPFSVAYVGEF